MKLDFSVAITAYELLAIVLSILALAIPFLKWLYKKAFLPLQLKYLPNDYTISLYFNESGAYADLGFVLQCKNASVIVNNINLCITRVSDNATLLLDWSAFISPYNQRVGENSVYSHETAHPLKIVEDSLPLFIIQFSNTNNVSTNKLKQIHAEKMDVMKGWDYRSQTCDEAIAVFEAQPKYRGYYDSILEEFFWKAGNYRFDIITTYDDTKKYSETFVFTIDEAEYKNLKGNVEKSLICRVRNNYYINANMYTLVKRFEIGGSRDE